jgi:hypothetical protein
MTNFVSYSGRGSIVITGNVFNHSTANSMRTMDIASNIPAAANVPTCVVQITNNTIYNSDSIAISANSFNTTIESNLLVNCKTAFQIGGGHSQALNNIKVWHNVKRFGLLVCVVL